MSSSTELNVTELFCIVLDRVSTTWTIKMLGKCWVGLVFRAMLTQFSSVTCLVVRSHALPLQTSPAAGQMFLFWYVFRSTPPSWPNNIRGGNVRPSFGAYVCPSVHKDFHF